MDHLQTIQQVFADRLFEVPDYQRGYAWEPRQCQDLLEDLEVLAPDDEHYTGTLVLHPTDRRVEDEGGSFQHVYEVVDGQQRITTIVILLDAIRREMQGLAGRAATAEGIRRSYVMALDCEKQPLPKLKLNRDTHRFFQDCVLSDTGGVDAASIESEKRLSAARECFAHYLRDQRADLGDEKFTEWLRVLQRKVTAGLKLTVYEARTEADVGVIFEVMNNRGKRLSELEKVKNYLLYVTVKIKMAAARSLAEDINGRWRDMLERLMRAGLSSPAHEDQMLRAHWIMAYDHDARRWSGSDSIKARFNLKQHLGRDADLHAALQEYVIKLDEFSIAYCDLMKPALSSAYARFQQVETRRALQVAGVKLARLDALVSLLPLFGALRLRHPEDHEGCLRLLDLGEKYAFRVFRRALRRANAGQSSLFKLGHELFHGRTSLDDALEEIRRLLLYYAPTETFERDLRQPGDWYRWYGLNYFLYEYEVHLAECHGRSVDLSWEQITRSTKQRSVEHILPQTPDVPYWLERWSEAQRKALTHDIGNLCLTFDNSSYSNKSFPDKKGTVGKGACYANSSLFMEKELAAYDDWTETELTARRSALVAWAEARWRVDPPTVAGSVDVSVDADDEHEGDAVASA